MGQRVWVMRGWVLAPTLALLGSVLALLLNLVPFSSIETSSPSEAVFAPALLVPPPPSEGPLMPPDVTSPVGVTPPIVASDELGSLATPPDELVHMFTRDEIQVVVVGGETNGYWRIFGASYGKTVSVDDWR